MLDVGANEDICLFNDYHDDSFVDVRNSLRLYFCSTNIFLYFILFPYQFYRNIWRIPSVFSLIYFNRIGILEGKCHLLGSVLFKFTHNHFSTKSVQLFFFLY